MFQVRYAFVNNLWECLVSLYEYFVRQLRKIETGDFADFRYLAGVGDENLGQFVIIMKHLILNLQMRFFTASFSLDKRVVKPFLDYDNMKILRGAPGGDSSRCGIEPVLELFNVRQTQVTSQLSVSLPHLDVANEWDRLVPFLISNYSLISTQSQIRNELMRKQEKEMRKLLGIPTIINLIDVFDVVPKTEYPSLWKFVVRILTIIPTTVACEQSFSYFKRTVHTNMGEKTAKSFLFARLNLYETIFDL